MNFRSQIFWIFDTIKGARIRKHYNDIAFINSLKGKELQDYHEEKISKLIDHATNSVKFYKNRELKRFEDFPVINKNIIRESQNDFLSSHFKLNELVSSVTSGSTGTPFKFYHNVNKKLRNSADTIFFAEKAGFSVGDKLYYLKIWSDNNKKNNVVLHLQNIKPVDVIKFGDNEIQELIRDVTSNKQPKGILGYASALELICQYLDRKGGLKDCKEGNTVSAISMSEALNDYTKERFKSYFGVELVARYSNLENGILAQQIPGSGGRYFINGASYFVEILNFNNDHPVKSGSLGRIVVTDLFNYGMPMIRYDTGDVGALSSSDNSFLEHVEGRKLDLLFDTSGNLVSSYIMYKNMWKYTQISQYQLVQEAEKQYIFKINCLGSFNKEKDLVAEFKHYLGEDADFKVEYVDEIPLLSSGKRKKVVNNYKNAF